MKEEALKLADELETKGRAFIDSASYTGSTLKLEEITEGKSAAMIRRLVARIEFSERFAFDMNIRAVRAEKAMQTKPLSDEFEAILRKAQEK